MEKIAAYFDGDIDAVLGADLAAALRGAKITTVLPSQVRPLLTAWGHGGADLTRGDFIGAMTPGATDSKVRDDEVEIPAEKPAIPDKVMLAVLRDTIRTCLSSDDLAAKHGIPADTTRDAVVFFEGLRRKLSDAGLLDKQSRRGLRGGEPVLYRDTLAKVWGAKLERVRARDIARRFGFSLQHVNAALSRLEKILSAELTKI